MKIIFSETASSGNLTIVEGENSMIAIDCGLKIEYVNKKINYKLHELSCLLCSHPHLDHTAYLSQFATLGIEIYLNAETMATIKDKRVLALSQLLEYDKKYDVGDFIVKPFPLKHNSHRIDKETGKQETVDCECTGFLIYEKSTKEKCLYITDTAFVHNQFPPVEYINIECNYFEVDNYVDRIDDIKTKCVEVRRMQSHMSFETCMAFINHQDLSKCKEIRLLHLSSSLSDKQRERIRQKAIKEIKHENIKVIV